MWASCALKHPIIHTFCFVCVKKWRWLCVPLWRKSYLLGNTNICTSLLDNPSDTCWVIPARMPQMPIRYFGWRQSHDDEWQNLLLKCFVVVVVCKCCKSRHVLLHVIVTHPCKSYLWHVMCFLFFLFTAVEINESDVDWAGKYFVICCVRPSQCHISVLYQLSFSYWPCRKSSPCLCS